jgi:hypothetical protein
MDTPKGVGASLTLALDSDRTIKSAGSIPASHNPINGGSSPIGRG